MKKFLFLDFDGVMDSAQFTNQRCHQGLPEADKYGVLFDPRCTSRLEEIVNKTGADIVITSSWKDWMTYEQLLAMWKERELPGFPIDSTPTCSNHRGNEIEEWLTIFTKESRGEDYRYVIIDDLGETDFNEEQFPYLVSVDPFNGLTDTDAEKAINILQGNKAN